MQQLNLTKTRRMAVRDVQTVMTVHIDLKGNWPGQATMTDALKAQGYRLRGYGIGERGAYVRLEPLATADAKARAA